MKEIQLSKGEVTVVDDEDFDWLNQWAWSLSPYGYAYRSSWDSKRKRTTNVLMHREIMQPSGKMVVDHINGNKLDNRRQNMRICTQAQNVMNQKKRLNNTSGFKGVTKVGDKWRSQIAVDNEDTYIGMFATPEEAALAYDTEARRIHGEYARLNFSDKHESQDSILIRTAKMNSKKEKVSKKTVGAYLSLDVIRQFENESAKRGVKMSSLISAACEYFIKNGGYQSFIEMKLNEYKEKAK